MSPCVHRSSMAQTLRMDAGAWLKNGNMSDNHVNIKYRMANRQDMFKPPYDQWVLTHYAKSDEVFIDNFSKILANTTTMVSEEPVAGPFTIALPGPKNSTEDFPRSL